MTFVAGDPRATPSNYPGARQKVSVTGNGEPVRNRDNRYYSLQRRSTCLRKHRHLFLLKQQGPQPPIPPRRGDEFIACCLLLVRSVPPGGSRVGRGWVAGVLARFGSCGSRSEELGLRKGTVARVLSTLGAQTSSHSLLNCKELFRTQARASNVQFFL